MPSAQRRGNERPAPNPSPRDETDVPYTNGVNNEQLDVSTGLVMSTLSNGGGGHGHGQDATNLDDARHRVASRERSPSQGVREAQAVTSSSSRQGFFSRLSLPLPLRNRNRGVTDFHIQCQDRHKTYSAGESVQGAVILVVVKSMRITHLVINLHGFVQVRKDATAAARNTDSSNFPQGDSAGRPQYHGNGFASLFSDEQILSGEGKLDPGKYEFGFDLVFPDQSLPSSIEFERGRISYMVTATLTRPTSINPVSSCETKLTLVESMDIGLLRPPRPRSIFLEPISKRTRRKIPMAVDRTSNSTSDLGDGGSESESVAASVRTQDSERNRSSDQRSVAAPEIRSEASGESSRSVSTARSRQDATPSSQMGSMFGPAAKQQAVDDKTIVATIELLRGGCLPGDMVSVRVSIQHIKRMKSMSGIIVTLYRQGKMDSSPPPARFGENGRGRYQNEDKYPKSKTRLGGLSLSSASSTSMFRKDLDQNLVPLYIDPVTMKASVTVSVKLPDDAFPTIKSVPGDMVSFKYQVEVIVDLSGRLSHQIQGQSNRYNNSGGASTTDSNLAFGSQRATYIADTGPLRREKGVISMSFETVVGTVDSSRTRRQKVSPSRLFTYEGSDADGAIHPELGYIDDAQLGQTTPRSADQARSVHFPPSPSDRSYEQPPPGEPPSSSNAYPPSRYASDAFEGIEGYEDTEAGRGSAPSYAPPSNFVLNPYPSPQGQRNGVSATMSRMNGNHNATMAFIPPPQIVDQQDMSEKDRIRAAEARLLPSQPPGPGLATSSGSRMQDGDDNDDDNDDDIYEAYDAPRLPRMSPMGIETLMEEQEPNEDPIRAASAPTMEDIRSTGSLTPSAIEDKQELQRRRLQLEASAPPMIPEDADGNSPNPIPSAPTTDHSNAEPSAPVFDEEYDAYPAPGGNRAGPSRYDESTDTEELPAYQR